MIQVLYPIIRLSILFKHASVFYDCQNIFFLLQEYVQVEIVKMQKKNKSCLVIDWFFIVDDGAWKQ